MQKQAHLEWVNRGKHKSWNYLGKKCIKKGVFYNTNLWVKKRKLKFQMLFPTRGIKDEQTRSFRVGSFLVNIKAYSQSLNYLSK